MPIRTRAKVRKKKRLNRFKQPKKSKTSKQRWYQTPTKTFSNSNKARSESVSIDRKGVNTQKYPKQL